ncbi:hypothetical protein F5B21DRAFT_509741 [Xylaria acuta]|nr:hypothetical protein F5B21DRAFT_509741 [Xylaria acuta]
MNEPEMVRSIPRDVEFIAPLRSANRYYESDGGRIMISEEQPDTDSNQAGATDTYTMCVQVPVVGHGAVINKELHVCGAMFASISPHEMINLNFLMPLSSLKRVVGANPLDVKPTTSMSQDIRARGHEPHVGQPVLETVTRHCGWRGLVFGCMTLSMGPSTGDDDDNANTTARIPSDEHDCVLDVCYTPQTKAGGRIRALEFGTQQRIETTRTREMAGEIISTIIEHVSAMNIAL